MKDSEFERLFESLCSKHYHLKKEWLKTCVEFIESNQETTVSFQTIMNLVIHQFLNFDISQSYEPQMKIPVAAARIMISKKMIFQILSHLNISSSIYEQLGEATKDTHSLSWFHGNQDVLDEREHEQQRIEDAKKKKKRGLIKLELTDGVNEVSAIEYAEEVFSEDQLNPGAKIILLNKVKCRKGMLFLDRSNCQPIGGRVEELEHDVVAQFAEKLKIDLDAEKNRRKIALEKANEMRRTKRDKQHQTQSSISPFLVKKDRLSVESKKVATSDGGVQKKTINSRVDDSFDDDILIDEDVQPTRKVVPQNSRMVQNETASTSSRRSVSPVRPLEEIEIEESRDWEFTSIMPPSYPSDSIVPSSIDRQKNEEFKKSKLNDSIDEWSFSTADRTKVKEVTPAAARFAAETVPKPIQEVSFNKNALNAGVVGKTCTFTEKPPPVEDFNVFQKKVKQLPKRLIEEPSPAPAIPNKTLMAHREVNPVEEEIEVYEPGKVRNLQPNDQISWRLKKIKDEMAEGKDDNVSDIIPPGFIQEETLRNNKNSSMQKNSDGQRKLIEKLTKDIHGPRNFRKVENKKVVDETKRDSLITNFFNNVKSMSKNRTEKNGIERNEKLIKMGIVTPVQKQKYKDSNENLVEPEKGVEIDEEENSDEEFEKMLQQVRSGHKSGNVRAYDETAPAKRQDKFVAPLRPRSMTRSPSPSFSPPPPQPQSHPQPPVSALTKFPPPPRPLPSQGSSDSLESILNGTMESEGRRECERWKVGIDSRQKNHKRRNEEDDDILVGWNPDVLTYKITKMDRSNGMEYQRVEHLNQFNNGAGCSSSQAPRAMISGPENAQSFSSRPISSMFPHNSKPEVPLPSQRKSKASSMMYSSSKEVAVIRQSSNVQHYKTPLARRIPSSENPTKFAQELINRFANLHIIPLKDALVNRKYWMMSKIVAVMPTCCQQMHELQSDGLDWQLKIRLNDTSASNIICLVSTDLLDRIFGFSVNQCKKLYEQSKMEELRIKKLEAERKLQGFKRLDLVVWIEVSPQLEKLPIIVDVKTVSDAVNIL